MQATVARLESEVRELQQSRTALHQDNAQQLESLEQLRRENAKLHRRVSITRDHSFPRIAEFQAEPRNCPFPRNFYVFPEFCGIWHWPVITTQIMAYFGQFQVAVGN